jgi:hypothetical protein
MPPARIFDLKLRLNVDQPATVHSFEVMHSSQTTLVEEIPVNLLSSDISFPQRTDGPLKGVPQGGSSRDSRSVNRADAANALAGN